jgi:hypothetical protein
MSIMSPTLARQRWCPFAMSQIPVVDRKDVAAIGGTSGNRVPNTGGVADRDCCCIAASCMAWRWEDSLTGYCGLVGRPTDNKETTS